MADGGSTRTRGALPVALRILLVAGFVVAVAATALVVFADDVRMLRLAAVLALWAALIAAFAVTRSRRDVRAAAMRQSEAQLAYELELHREVAARRDFEADLSKRVAAAQSDQMAELRGQLARLTGVLSSLADGELTVSRLTLSAESARFRPGQPVASGGQAVVTQGDDQRRALAGVATIDADAERWAGPLDADADAPGRNGADPDGPTRDGEDPDATAATGADVPGSVTVANDPSAAPPHRPEAPAAAWARRHAEWVGGRQETPPRPASPAVAVDHEDTRPIPMVPAAVPADAVPADAVPAAPPADAVPADDSPPADDDGPGDHESGVSVAELLAAYGLSGRTRRRRRD